MRIFRVGSKNRKLRKQNSLPPPIETAPSIGSELAASDQFEIVVARREYDGSGEQQRRKPKSGLFSYFSSDNDDSTVSSITTLEYGGFFNGRRPNYIHNATKTAAESISSWCCCGDSDSSNNNTTSNATRRTHPSSTDNTLIQHSTNGTILPNDSRSLYRSISGSHCCGPDGSVSPLKRQRSFLFSTYYWGRGSRNINSNKTRSYIHSNSSMKNNAPNMSASLFDDLSEDELDINVKRSSSFSVGRRSNKNLPDPPGKPVSMRRAMTWKRRVL